MSFTSYPCKNETPETCGWGRINRIKSDQNRECTYPGCYYGKTLQGVFTSGEVAKSKYKIDLPFEAIVHTGEDSLGEVAVAKGLTHEDAIQLVARLNEAREKKHLEFQVSDIVMVRSMRLRSNPEYEIRLKGEIVI